MASAGRKRKPVLFMGRYPFCLSSLLEGWPGALRLPLALPQRHTTRATQGGRASAFPAKKKQVEESREWSLSARIRLTPLPPSQCRRTR